MMWTIGFWKAALERAIKTAAQVLLLVWTGDEAFNVLRVNWEETLGLVIGGFILSILTSLLSGLTGPPGPSLANEVVLEPNQEVI